MALKRYDVQRLWQVFITYKIIQIKPSWSWHPLAAPIKSQHPWVLLMGASSGLFKLTILKNLGQPLRFGLENDPFYMILK